MVVDVPFSFTTDGHPTEGRGTVASGAPLGTVGVVIEVFDRITSTSMCHCTLGSCSTSTNTALSCFCDAELVTP